MTPKPVTVVRRSAAILAAALVSGAASIALAAPAHAEVPVGWSEPEPVNMLHALLVLGGIPLALFVVIALAVYVPALVRGERVAPGAPLIENQWLGGPRGETTELAGPDDDGESESGGASARW